MSLLVVLQWLQKYDASTLTILLALPLSVLILLLLSYHKRDLSRRGPLPPSPSRLPIIGNLHQIGSIPHQSLRDLSQKYGPLMLLQLGQIPTLVVSSAEMAREVLQTQDAIFASRPPMDVADRLFYNNNDMAFAPYGKYWRHMKKIGNVHLLNTKKVQSFGLEREEEVAAMIGNITHSSSAFGLVNLSEILTTYTNDLIARIAAGKCFRDEGKENPFYKLIREQSLLMGGFHLGEFFPSLAWLNALTGFNARVQKLFNKWDAILEEVVDEHVRRSRDKGSTQNSDFVDVLLNLQKDLTMDFPLTKESIKGLIMDMFSGGTDTSHVTLDWAMAELVHNPEVMQKVQDEVRGITGQKPIVQHDDLREMNYLRAVIKETLRLHPPATLLVPHASTEDTQIKGYIIPKKTRVLVNAWAIGRDPTVWEAPEEFQPERFLHTSLDFIGNDFQFIPFGAGRRICPGIQFSVHHLELALANLLHQFDWGLPNGITVKDFDMAEGYGITTCRKLELCLVAIPRSN